MKRHAEFEWLKNNFHLSHPIEWRANLLFSMIISISWTSEDIIALKDFYEILFQASLLLDKSDGLKLFLRGKTDHP